MVFRARQGDAAAWERLVQVHQEPIFRLAYLILGDSAEAEDVSQDTFIRAYLHLDRFSRDKALRPWLLAIAANISRNRLRSAGRFAAALQRLWRNKGLVKDRPVESTIQDDAQILWTAVRQLRPKAQEVIFLRHFLELSELETAAALDIAPGTVKSRLHRALKQLRPIIAQEYPELWREWNQ